MIRDKIRTCIIQDCDLILVAKGLCQKHYSQLKRNGDPNHRTNYVSDPKNRKCSVIGCLKEYYLKGFCCSHYSRNKMNGNPLINRREKLNEEKVLQIRARLKNNENFKDLSKEYNVSEKTILGIKYGQIWKKVQDNEKLCNNK